MKRLDEGQEMVRSQFVHYGLVAAATALLAGLVYVQMSDYLPERMQMSSQIVAARQQNPACALADVPREHEFVAASMWEGGIPTDLVIGNPPEVMQAARVHVTAGEKPITVFLAGYHAIFEFTGDVGRVARVIAVSPTVERRVAVAGIPADRVEFPLQQRECKLFLEAGTSDDEIVRVKALAVMFGRPPSRAIYQSKVIQITIPDGTFGVRPDQVSAKGARRALDPADLIAASPVTRPEVLPGEAGLAQLEGAGAIHKPLPEEIEAFVLGASSPYRSKISPDFRFRIKLDYVITREVTLPEPPPMKQWHFLVAEGVPPPHLSKYGHACIARMDGFAVNDARSCYGEAHEGLEKLRAVPPDETLAACRMLKLSETVSLQAISAYQPDAANHGLEAKRTPQPIDVQVETEGKVVLILNSYEPAIWRLSSGPNSRITGVLLVGHHPSMVEGVPDSLVIADELSRPKRTIPAPECGSMRSWHSAVYRGGPDALVFDRQVRALTGRNLDGLYGSYSLKAVTVR
ncbi:MAG: hypothetical protein ACJ8F3_00220 [Xanthobacteraceae bacterium]